MLEVLENKYAFYNIKPKKCKILPFIIILIIILIYILIKVRVYENYQTKGYVLCDNSCTITTYIPTSIDYKEIYLDNKKENIEIISKNIKVDQEQLISYQELTFTTNKHFDNNEIIDINFYYHKQSLLNKIKDLMF